MLGRQKSGPRPSPSRLEVVIDCFTSAPNWIAPPSFRLPQSAYVKNGMIVFSIGIQRIFYAVIPTSKKSISSNTRRFVEIPYEVGEITQGSEFQTVNYDFD